MLNRRTKTNHFESVHFTALRYIQYVSIGFCLVPCIMIVLFLKPEFLSILHVIYFLTNLKDRIDSTDKRLPVFCFIDLKNVASALFIFIGEKRTLYYSLVLLGTSTVCTLPTVSSLLLFVFGDRMST